MLGYTWHCNLLLASPLAGPLWLLPKVEHPHVVIKSQMSLRISWDRCRRDLVFRHERSVSVNGLLAEGWLLLHILAKFKDN